MRLPSDAQERLGLISKLLAFRGIALLIFAERKPLSEVHLKARDRAMRVGCRQILRHKCSARPIKCCSTPEATLGARM